MNTDKSVREHVLYLLKGGGAHLSFDEAVRDFPEKLRGRKVEGAPHTAWQLMEHMRLAQWDIVEFTRNPKHVSPRFPEGYWPLTESPPDDTAWNSTVKLFRADLKIMQGFVADLATDLYTPIPHGEGQTVLREALLVADHNAYHLGQLVFIRRLLGA